MAEWIPDSIYRQLCDELLTDPLPTDTVVDDHEVTPVEPGWFLPFDEVDSRTIRDAGAPA